MLEEPNTIFLKSAFLGKNGLILQFIIEKNLKPDLSDLRKMVFGSSSTFSRVLRVPQNQREFIKIRAALGFVFTVICIISDLSFLIRLIKVTPLMPF